MGWNLPITWRDLEPLLQRHTRLPHIDVRRLVRLVAVLLFVAGALAGVWVIVVWQWKDPFTSIYTWYEQRRLVGKYDDRVKSYRPLAPGRGTSPQAVRRVLSREARAYRLASRPGEPIARLEVPRLGLNMIVVNGTDSASLAKGPGRDLRTFMPGEGKLTYIAGHRTTYLAPFSHIEKLRKGDSATLSLPYGVFRYEITGHRIVPADDVSRLRSRGFEQLALQACHPRFFATKRYIAYARPVSVKLPGGRVYRLWR